MNTSAKSTRFRTPTSFIHTLLCVQCDRNMDTLKSTTYLGNVYPRNTRCNTDNRYLFPYGKHLRILLYVLCLYM